MSDIVSTPFPRKPITAKDARHLIHYCICSFGNIVILLQYHCLKHKLYIYMDVFYIFVFLLYVLYI